MLTQPVQFNAELVAANVPACLRERDQWVCWQYVDRDGKLTKCPISPTKGGNASSTDPATWGTFEQALTACRAGDLDGVGFVFGADDPFAGVDLDNCIDPETGQPKPWAQAILKRINSYCEISPSGTGVKIFVQASKPGKRCKTGYEDGVVELYGEGRYFTVTGARLTDYSADVEARQPEFGAAYEYFFNKANPEPSQPAKTEAVGALSDDEIIKLASENPKNGVKFSALWAGELGTYRSASEADSALVFRLAYFTKEPAQLDRLFRRSGLMREKWDELRGEKKYGDMTIAKALSAVKKQYKPRERCEVKPKAARPIPPPPSKPALPAILIDDVQLSDLTHKAIEALTLANRPPAVFVRGGCLVRVVEDECHNPKAQEFDSLRMRCRLGEVANFFTSRKIGNEYQQVGAHPPKSLAENVLAMSGWSFPALGGIARAPILRPDGTICTKPGYDASTRLLYCPDPGLHVPDIPDAPNRHDIDACVKQLFDLIADFPFADEASPANALAVLFTLLMRPVIRGHVPLAIFDAPMQGTGKTLLATALASIALGHVAGESIPAKQNDDEWRKKITTILMRASQFVLLDNIPDNSTIDWPPLAAALTMYEWSDRILGGNVTAQLPSRAVWAATGNNLRVTGDMPRRCYTIRLDANAERPWERTGFQIEDLDAYVAAHRGELLCAALIIIRGWYAHGQPAADVPPFGSFDEWAQTIGSVLAYGGVEGFLANLDHTRTVQDDDTQQWSAFFTAWRTQCGDATVTVEELCRGLLPEGELAGAALPDALLVNRDRGEGALRRSLGKQLARLSGRIFDGYKLCDAGQHAHKKVRIWRLERVNSEVVTPLTPQFAGLEKPLTPHLEMSNDKGLYQSAG